MKQLIEIHIGDFDTEVLNGLSFHEAGEILKKYPETLSLSYSDYKLKVAYSYEEESLEIWAKRLETDSEYASRFKKEEQENIKQQKKLLREKAQYEKLKAKFENK